MMRYWEKKRGRKGRVERREEASSTARKIGKLIRAAFRG
jgi:hypothetical protein